MIKKPYFVILSHQKEEIFEPLTDDDGELLLFETDTEAARAAINTIQGQYFQWEVFELGSGCLR